MSKIYLTLLTASFVFVVSSYSFASENTDMAAFYADEKNKIAFNNAVKSGMLQKGRDQMKAMCLKEKENKKDKSIDCDCFVKELKNISDEEMFYDSVTSYREYQERVQASKENNEAKLEQLKQKHAKRNGLGKKLDIACGGK